MDHLDDQLSELGIAEENLIRLDTAQAFVVTVNPEQLRNISKLKLAGSIRLNRKHKL